MRTKTCTGYRVKDTTSSHYVDVELSGSGDNKKISRAFTRRHPPPPDTLEMALEVLKAWEGSGHHGHLVPVTETA